MAKIPSIRQQMFGDLNKHLNNIRAQMNEEVREKCFEILERKREPKGGTEKSEISGTSQKQVFGGDADGS